ncbi:BOK, BCL2 family apoptosis regulator [Ictidomys tridecemlineatus]|uniref:bcl-2-related ovarian killer protein n=1 Tax=Ictidomys tridecemlineatus TaxID=43179 RepID=UPI00038C16EB|nr:bcl-2-related ovarian killer protein [Ictidomys tridecemlineatus]KAG3275725.1 BOK, BCL2 family apoptosis regulator [Ictidomys tridecemlineatus]
MAWSLQVLHQSHHQVVLGPELGPHVRRPPVGVSLPSPSPVWALATCLSSPAACLPVSHHADTTHAGQDSHPTGPAAWPQGLAGQRHPQLLHGLFPWGWRVRQSQSADLLCAYAGDELEQIRPSVYRNVAGQLHLSVQSEPVVTDAFLAVAGHIFSAGITWGKVVSLYAVAAGLAVDCVRQAQPAMVHALVDCLGEFVRKTLAAWLRRRGGWTDVLRCVVSTDPGLRAHWLVAALCSFGRFLKAAFFMLLPER